MHRHFHSPYEGTNSLRDIIEYKASEVATLYLGYQLWPNSRYNTDLIVDFENAGGRGISQALGLAGQTNLDVVRNPEHRAVSFLAARFTRLSVSQTQWWMPIVRSFHWRTRYLSGGLKSAWAR
jgi:hypothetical protein